MTVAEPTAVTAARAFVDAVDRGRVGEISRLCRPDATWWVDTGADRAAGSFDRAPATERGHGWPLHGRLDVGYKLGLMREIGPGAFPDGVRHVVECAFGDDRVAVVEAVGDGFHQSGAHYQNRYGFVIEVDDTGLIVDIREYLDTLHADDILGDGRRPERTRIEALPLAIDAAADGDDRRVALVLGLWECLARGDLDGFGAAFAPGAAWWTDSGLDRERGRFDRLGGPPWSWPLHGVVPMNDKLDYMRRRVEEGYRTDGVDVRVTRSIVGQGRVAVEASGHADLADGAAYQNRYLFVATVTDAGISEMREYCDTFHIADIMGVDTAPSSRP